MGPAKFPLRNPDWKTLQAYLTDDTVNSFFMAAKASGKPVDISGAAAKLNYTITTDQVAVVVPLILTKYGSGKAVSVAVTFENSLSYFTIAHTGANVTANVFVDI